MRYLRMVRRIKESGGFTQSLHPIHTTHRRKKYYHLGFDTEYSNVNVLVSYQLSYQGHAEYYRVKEGDVLNLESLYATACDLVKRYAKHYAPTRQLVLWAWWNPAELSHIDKMTATFGDTTIIQKSSFGTYNIDFRESYQTKKNETRHWTKMRIGDLYRLYQCPLEEAAGLVGRQKGDWFKTHDHAEPDNPDFITYAIEDALITDLLATQTVDSMWAEYQVDIVRYSTAASIGMYVFRKNYLMDDVEQRNLTLREMAIYCPHGAHAEAYKRGTFTNVNEHDYVSLYPSTVVHDLQTLPCDWDWRELDPGPLKPNPKINDGIVGIDFKYPAGTIYPGIPILAKNDTWQYPLSGEGAVCTYGEAADAVEQGASVYIHIGYVYDKGTGTDALARFHKDEMAKKDACEAAGDMIGRQMHKNNNNHTIGKFDQHNGGIDYNALTIFCKDKNLPVRMMLNNGVYEDGSLHKTLEDFRHMNIPKNCWVPEWHAMIIGRSRLNALKLVRQSTNPVMLSTDAVVAEGVDVIGLNVKVDAKFPEPMTVIALRTKMYSLLAPDGYTALQEGRLPQWLESPDSYTTNKKGKKKNRWRCAHHALHLRDKESLLFLNTQSDDAYQKTVKSSLLQSLRGTAGWLDEKRVDMHVSRAWDGKRILHPDGTTEPWNSVFDYDYYQDSIHMEARTQRAMDREMLKGVSSIVTQRKNVVARHKILTKRKYGLRLRLVRGKMVKELRWYNEKQFKEVFKKMPVYATETRLIRVTRKLKDASLNMGIYNGNTIALPRYATYTRLIKVKNKDKIIGYERRLVKQWLYEDDAVDPTLRIDET